MLKLCLQLLVCLTIVVRLLALAGHLRRIWRRDGGAVASPAVLEGQRLAGEFRRELLRRGLPAGDPSTSP